MKSTKLSNRTSFIAIVGLLFFTAIIFFIRCYYHEPSGDELLYQYVWEEDDPTDLWTFGHRFERQVSSLQDVVQTQILHYQIVNGRSLVHAVEQLFTNHELAFSVINTCVFLLFVFFIVRCVSFGTPFGRRYILWFYVIACLLLLFPYQESLWISVNYGLNYLWPATISIGVLLIWQRLMRSSVNPIWSLPIMLIALVAGWTHESFVVGLAGGMFLYYCFNLRKFKGQVLWLCIPYWFSACIMVFAPGNINRFFYGSGGGSFFIKLTNGFDNLLHLWIFWILVVGIVIILARHNKIRLQYFCKYNIELILVFIVAFVFSMIANTAPYSHTMVELMALLIIFRYICLYTKSDGRIVKICAIILTILLVCHQCVLAYDTVYIYKKQHDIIERYKQGEQNVFEIDEDVNSMSKPFIRLWNGRSKDFFAGAYTYVYGGNAMELLKTADMEALTAPSTFFVEKNRVNGNAYVYKANDGDYMWLNPDSLCAGDVFEAELYPVDFSHDSQFLVKVKFALFQEAYENSEILQTDTVNSQFGQAYRIKPLPVRKIKSIKLIRNEVAKVDSIY